uniref:Uncharacterized protein n=1 Tax=Heterorhabditis bacteriophora TaxID=37862 RepID=A0A1I7WF74_HETBA
MKDTETEQFWGRKDRSCTRIPPLMTYTTRPSQDFSLADEKRRRWKRSTAFQGQLHCLPLGQNFSLEGRG